MRRIFLCLGDTARPGHVRSALLISCSRKSAVPLTCIPVFVVSLPDCLDRRQAISQALSALGIEFEFVDAVDGRYGLDPQYEDQIDRVEAQRVGRILSDAEFACALSHLTIYRRIVSENLAYALVLEDDAVPSPQLVEFLVNHHYRDADLTQLYTSRAYVRRSGIKAILNTYTSYLCLPRVPAVYTVAYTVSYWAALHFVTHAVPVTTVADWPTCINTLIAKRQVRIIYPLLAEHSNTPSLIGRYGQQINRQRKAMRRYFGIYIPPFRSIVDSLVSGSSFHKLIAKRLP
ncbi:MAG: glycosyltransferase family 25 protein [Nitrospira sp. SB0667_bin_9]|nr:glycosyltransferase family 25 protein [Nitrospira sp. SB0667_bin_9]